MSADLILCIITYDCMTICDMLQYIVHKNRVKLIGSVQHCVGDQQDATAVCLAVKPLKMNSLKKRLERGRGLEGVS